MLSSCSYAQHCWQLVQGLVPSELFRHEHDKCHCSDCEEVRARNDGRGSTPQGYVRFGVAVNEHHARSRGVFTSWHKAYHGTSHKSVGPICKLGFLLPPGAVTPEGIEVGIRDGHLTKDSVVKINLASLRSGRSGITGDVKLSNIGELTSEFHPERCVFVSANHAYAACPVYAETAVIDGSKVTFLLEFRIMPRSFDCGSHTVTAKTLEAVKKNCDARFTLSDEKWEEFTDRFGVMVLTGVCVRAPDFIKPTPKPTLVPGFLSSLLGLAPTPAIGGGAEGGAAVAARAKRAYENFAKFSTCPTASRRFQILESLGLPDGIFDREHFICYCPDCQPDKGQAFRRGDMTYRLPHGFTGFALQIDEARFKLLKVFEEFPVAYHGTTRPGVQGILNAGMMIPAGTKGPDGKVVGHRESNAPAADDIKRISFSPIVGYATHPSNATPTILIVQGTPREVRLALQLRVHPKCFATKPSTVAEYQVAEAEKIYVGQEEWYTPRHGCVFVYRVLISDAPVPKK